MLKRHWRLAFLSFLVVLQARADAPDNNVDLPRYPSLSPDGSMITFSWRGDLWTVQSKGGTAVRLTAHPADDLYSAWSPDGKMIAFTSTRDGYQNIHLMTPEGQSIRQLTFSDRPCRVTGFMQQADGSLSVLFHSSRENDVYREYRPYRIQVGGGDIERVHDAFGSFPAQNPRDDRMLFSRGGYYEGWDRRHFRGPETSDIWLQEKDGDFSQLTTWPGNDGKAKWSGEASFLYLSDREDRCVNLYRQQMGRRGEEPRRLTSYKDHDILDFDVSRDGRMAVLHTWEGLSILHLSRSSQLPIVIEIRASEDAGEITRLQKINAEVREAVLSPDAKVMAMVAWGEVYVRAVKDDSPTRRITRNPARESGIAWSPDGLFLYFSSDRDGSSSIYRARVAGTRSEVKAQFEEEEEPATPADPVSGTWMGSIDDPALGMFDFTLRLHLEDDGIVNGSLDSPVMWADLIGTFDAGTDALSLASKGDGQAVLTFNGTITGPVLIGNATGDTFEQLIIHMTREPAEDDPPPSEEMEGDDGEDPLPPEMDPSRWHDALRFTIESVLARPENDYSPAPSPDGVHLAFRSGRGDLGLLHLEDAGVRTLFEHWDFSLEYTWSPDGQSIAYAQQNLDFNSDIFILPIDGSSPPVNISRHPNDDLSPSFSADGRWLAFSSARVNDQHDIYLVALDKDLAAMTDLDRDEWYAQALKAAGKRLPLPVDPEERAVAHADMVPPSLDLEDAWLRVRRITKIEGNQVTPLLSPGADRIVFSSSGDLSGIYSVAWDGSDRELIADAGVLQQVSLTGKTVVYGAGGSAHTAGITGGSKKNVSISDRIQVNRSEESRQKFLEISRVLGELFFDPGMNGVDWSAVTDRYLQHAVRARTPNEFDWIANRFIGELNGSHLGVRGPAPSFPNRRPVGRLGIESMRVPDDGYRVTGVVPGGPTAEGPMALRVEDTIIAINFAEILASDTLDALLRDSTSREIVLTIRRPGEEETIDILVEPVSYSTDRQLRYEAWRQENARLVADWSGGRLGYIHIQSMGQPSLDVFERDLYAAAEGREGLVLDVRNNGGGWTTDRVLASIMVQSHAWTIPRGADPAERGHYPEDRLFIQRYLMPMNLLCNEKSYSNAEIMSHAFKTLRRGTLVGEQTNGSVISTGSFSLVDGTRVRLPFRGWFIDDGSGTNMELHGAVPDIRLPQTPEAESRGVDEQLRVAVDDLLSRLASTGEGG